MHAGEDAMLLQLFEENLIHIVPGTDWLISPINGMLMVLFFLALGILLHQARQPK